MKIRIFGDSHVGALYGVSPKFRLPPGVAMDFYSAHGVNWSNCKITETGAGFRLQQDDVPKSKPVDYTVEKNQDLYVFSSVLHSAPTYRNQVWQKFCPWQCAVANTDLQAVSDAVIHQWVSEQMTFRFAMLERLKGSGLNIAVIEPPKPLQRTPGKFGIRADVLATASEVHRSFVVSWLEKRGIPVIPAPASSYNGEGFTESMFEAANPADPHHGNWRFARDSLSEVVAFATRASPAAN